MLLCSSKAQKVSTTKSSGDTVKSMSDMDIDALLDMGTEPLTTAIDTDHLTDVDELFV